MPTLLGLVLPVEPSWEGLRDDLAALSGYAVNYRYPGEEADRDMARKAVALCRKVREQVRLSMGLEP